MDKKLLGKRINIARKERGWTSERLSEACNINATYLRQIEWQITMITSMIRSALDASKD